MVLDELLELQLERLDTTAKKHGLGWSYRTGRIGAFLAGEMQDAMYETVRIYQGMRRWTFSRKNAIVEAIYFIIHKMEGKEAADAVERGRGARDGAKE